MAQRGSRYYYRSPRKGSKSREYLLMALSPEGLPSRLLQSANHNHTATVEQWRNFGGWDVRSFPVAKRIGARGRGPTVYRVVGKSAWNGHYRDLTGGSR